MPDYRLCVRILRGAREILDPDYRGAVDSIREGKYGILLPMCSGNKLGAQDMLEAEEEMLADAMIRFAKGELGNKYTSDVLFECASRFSMDKSIAGWMAVLGE